MKSLCGEAVQIFPKVFYSKSFEQVSHPWRIISEVFITDFIIKISKVIVILHWS